MASQQIHFAETIRAMKLAMRRSGANASDSESDDPIRAHTNRGNKLQRRAQFVREGRLDDTGGQSAYKRKVNHAGYDRYIVSKRRKLYDADGDLIDPQDYGSDIDPDEFPYGEPVEEDAFGQVKLDQLLRPLTSASELQHHPSMSQAYTSTALTQMSEEAAEMIRREKASLWKAKRLLQKFRGDGGWITCGTFSTEQDGLLLHEADDGSCGSYGMHSMVPSITMDDGDAARAQLEREQAEQAEAAAKAAEKDTETRDQMNGVLTKDHVTSKDETATGENGVAPEDKMEQENGTVDGTNEGAEGDQQNEGSDQDSNEPSHAMTTRARARSPQNDNGSASPSPSDSASIPTIHPWFVAPTTALVDRDLGLPPGEAEDTRKLLLLYVQKQENIVRELSALFEGIQRTDRLRTDIWRSAKAEGHVVPGPGGRMVTEMSDGEDWYDPADWNIRPHELRDGELEKGKDEIDDVAEDEGRRVGGRRRRVVGR